MDLYELRAECYRLLGIDPASIIHLVLPSTKRNTLKRKLLNSPLGILVKTTAGEDIVAFDCWHLYCWTFYKEREQSVTEALPPIRLTTYP